MSEMVIERHQRPKCPRQWLASSARIWWALWRCSRNRWLSPKEILRLGDAYASCISGCPRRLVMYALDSHRTRHCLEVGMLSGESALQFGDKNFDEFASYIKQPPKRGYVPPELKLLQLQLKGKHCGR